MSAGPDGHVFLVGFMGSGKSTVGSLLAEMLGVDCIDLDAMVERRRGSSVRGENGNGGNSEYSGNQHRQKLAHFYSSMMDLNDRRALYRLYPSFRHEEPTSITRCKQSGDNRNAGTLSNGQTGKALTGIAKTARVRFG